MKAIITTLLILTTCLVHSQEQDCKKLNSTEHQKTSGASPYNDCCVNDAERADKLLLQPGNAESLIKIHSPFGTPKSENKNIITLVSQTYITGYDTLGKIPIWVMYKLPSKLEVQAGLGRNDCFRYDPRIPESQQISYNEYDQPGNDSLQRGHMKPSADGYRNLSDNLNTFVMTNMAPQHKTFNMCEWEILESFVRNHSQTSKVTEAYVISGSVVTESSIKLNKKVTVPDAFYKVYFFKIDGKWNYWTFYINHDWTMMKFDEYKKFLETDRLTIDQIEAKARINLFVASSDDGVPEATLDNSFNLKSLSKYPNWCGN